MSQPVRPRPPQPSDRLVRPDGSATTFFYTYLRQQELYIQSLEARLPPIRTDTET